MWRLAAFLIVIVLVACIAAWLLTGKAAYRLWAIRLGKWSLAAILLFFGLLVIERLTGLITIS